ncbi:hypothetical protein LPJ53_000056 [Coemansia erecta]|uniref:Uncharacterized protein n=1 Tax=Coemansia erecta TaxID=147472 RepID=A0A9W7Y6X5_9FUNG|nr:hypothetical protein LPJ53_000056 [Coemansia erecta]
MSSLLPNAGIARVYVLAVLVLAFVFIMSEAYILYLTKQGEKIINTNQWQIPEVQDAVSSSITTYMVYNVLFILAQVYIIFLCLEALMYKNTIQVIAVIVFYIVCQTYTAARYISFYVLPSLAARIFLRDRNMQLMQVSVMAMYAIALASLVVLSYKLKKDVGWSVFRKLGADISLHRAYAWHQCLTILLKIDIYFVGSYLVQMTALILKADDIETWLQITVFIPFCIVVIVGAFYALYGERRRLMIAIASCIFLSVGYFIFKIVRVCDSSIVNKPGDPYADNRPFIMITIVTCMLLVIATGLASIKCIQNFDSGLKEAIAYDEMRIRHQKMYATAVPTDEKHESGRLLSSQDSPTRDRFALD